LYSQLGQLPDGRETGDYAVVGATSPVTTQPKICEMRSSAKTAVKCRSTARIRRGAAAGGWRPLPSCACNRVGPQQFLGKDIALQQEGVIALQRVQCVFERAGHRRNVCQLLGVEFVDVFVQRLAGSILFSMPSRPASTWRQMPGTDCSSGLAAGTPLVWPWRIEYIGIRQAAERLRRE